MKKIKILTSLFVALMVLLPLVSTAKNEQKIDRKELKAKDVIIHNKKPIPAIEKGKPVKPPVIDTSQFSATGTPGDSASGNKYAIVIGICDYPGLANDICKSDGDAKNMHDALVTKYSYAEENIYLLRDMGATYDSIADAVDAVKAKVQPNDEVVFFFSGHGTTGRVNDGDAEKLDEGIVTHNGTNLIAIWDGQLRNWFSDINTSRVIFIFDSCKAGGMNDVAKDGRVVVMSSAEAENSFVYTNGEFGEGLFSHFFVNEGMLQNKADTYNQLNFSDLNVAVEEASVYAKEKVSSFANTYLWHSQTVNVSDLFVNDLVL
ncbi:MAG: polysaccharide deacetylase [uncultured bacterium]|nr:MAG: polysaccharide deacetylase [uncultured bacterium]HBR71489.1 polysaccharide deacetylase [Candidatus Moranbacteria bacterium]